MLGQSGADMLTPVHLHQGQRVPVLSHERAAEKLHLVASYALHNSISVKACMRTEAQHASVS